MLENSSVLSISDERLELRKDHAYFYQIQAQLLVTELEYCDFVLWMKQDYYIKRVEVNDTVREEIIQTSFVFFRKAILPELVGKCFSRTCADEHSVSNSTTQEELWCYCKQPESGTMIGCDGQKCKIQWFHLECVKIEQIPVGKWFCPDCCSKKKNIIITVLSKLHAISIYMCMYVNLFQCNVNCVNTLGNEILV